MDADDLELEAKRQVARWRAGHSNDLVFTLQVYRDPAVPFALSGTAASIKSIETVEAVDATTAVATWKTTYYRPLDLPLMPSYYTATMGGGPSRGTSSG